MKEAHMRTLKMTGPELRTLRVSTFGLTQTEFGRIFAVANNTVSFWERGAAPIPRGVIIALRQTLGQVKLEELVEDALDERV